MRGGDDELAQNVGGRIIRKDLVAGHARGIEGRDGEPYAGNRAADAHAVIARLLLGGGHALAVDVGEQQALRHPVRRADLCVREERRERVEQLQRHGAPAESTSSMPSNDARCSVVSSPAVACTLV